MTSSIANDSLSVHLTAEQLHNVAFAATPLAEADNLHLITCATCQALLADLQLLRRELAVAQASRPSAVAQKRYLTIFAEAQGDAGNLRADLTTLIAGFADAVKASVLWNGRERLALQGVRNAAATGYRMLYRTPQAEIELMIEAVGSHFKVEGELLPVQEERQILPILLELYPHHDTAVISTPIYHGESDAEGRFHLPLVPAGNYLLALVPPQGAPMIIDGLELM